MLLYLADSHMLQAGEQCLVSLVAPILAKDGQQYRYLSGLARMCWVQTYSSKTNQTVLVMGSEEPNLIMIPLTNVAAIQSSNKVLKNPDLLIIK